MDELIEPIAGVDDVDEEGGFTWTRIDKGTYSLSEKGAPGGYNIKPSPITIEVDPTIDANGALSDLSIALTDPDGFIVASDADAAETGKTKVNVNKAGGIAEFFVRNYTMAELPSTGGTGLYIVLAGAGAALASFGGFAVMRKKAEKKA